MFRLSRTFIVCLVALGFMGATSKGADRTLSLAGPWQLGLEPADAAPSEGPADIDFDDSMRLPGTTAAQRKGPAEGYEPRLDRASMERLRERHPFVGVAWYQRKVTVPLGWADREIRLTLERVLWESRVWIDGRPVGEPQRSLSVPHRHDLTDRLKPGAEHTITLRIDNRQVLPIGAIGHAYTAGTQTLWNGVLGDLTLEAMPRQRIDHARVVGEPDGRLAIAVRTTAGPGYRLVAEVEPIGPANPSRIEVASGGCTADNPVVSLRGVYRAAKPWSEASPQRYLLSLNLVAPEGGVVDTHRAEFGFRDFTANGRELRINGSPVFLRGNLECAIFPATGHPDADGPQWRKIMRVARDYGLNHLRFHSWCPPRAAFEAADESGVYLQVELPNWTFKMGQNPPVDAFFLAEGQRILREYANHPSFVLMALGNELDGDLASMDRLIERLREVEPRMLYTSTSYAFNPRGLLPGPEDDFFISQRTKSGWVRGQGFLNVTFPTTNTDYSEGASCIDVPLVSHEVGQYVVYPNLAELPKYEATPLRSTALEAIRDDLKSKGLLGDAARFTRDSGKLAALLYKEDIERALRTETLSGIQLLQLQDFPGQSTATVGLLDAFWDSKGLIAPEAFRQFSAPIVPLARFDRFVWRNDERFEAKLELANFSEASRRLGFEASLVDGGGRVVASQTYSPRQFRLGNGLEIGPFAAGLAEVAQASRLDFVVRAIGAEAENSWPVWVYPAEESTPEVVVHQAADDACFADLAAGRSVLLLPRSGSIRKPISARFIPVFWSPLHFPNQPGTLGATIDAEHPLWRSFPTDTHTNWQWWELTAESTAVDLSGYDASIAKPFRFVDKYNRNALPTGVFEARVGSGKLLVCTLDCASDTGDASPERLVATQLLRALKRRVAAPDFTPTGTLTPAELAELFSPTSLEAVASSSHPDYPAANAVDGDPTTIWHSDWTDAAAKLPITLTIDLNREEELAGVRIASRSRNRNGRVSGFRVETSLDGKTWTGQLKNLTLPDSSEPQEFSFSTPAKTRFLRFVAESSHTGAELASLAEIVPLSTEPRDVRDLGIIEGFND